MLEVTLDVKFYATRPWGLAWFLHRKATTVSPIHTGMKGTRMKKCPYHRGRVCMNQGCALAEPGGPWGPFLETLWARKLF